MRRIRKGVRRWGLPLVLILAVACSAVIFRAQYRYDNKYTAWRPAARNGVMWLENESLWGSRVLLLHLVDGWEVYRDILLNPEEIPGHRPDKYLFLGQYSGLNFGDRSAPTYGNATYRTTIITDGVSRSYGLELPEIYSAYRLWINGVERAGKGQVGEGYRPEIGGAFLSFEAEDIIEIVLQVTDYSGYYSGMIYPPAFGAPDAVQRVLTARMLAHGVAWAAALVLGVFCLVPWQGLKNGGRRQLLLSLFCFFFILYTGYPLVHGWGLAGNLWYGVERASRQLMTVCLLLLTGELCQVNKRLVFPAAAAGLFMALLMLYPQALPGWAHGGFYVTSFLLRWWHRLASLLLVGFGVWGVRFKRVSSVALLAGALIFACATVMDQLHRYYEPVVSGYFAETSGFMILIIVAGVLRRVAWDSLREQLSLRQHRALLEARVDAQVKAMEAERDYMERVHVMRHEMDGRLNLLQSYLRQGNPRVAQEYLAGLLQQGEGEMRPVSYTGHQLIDEILTAQLAKAAAMNVALEWKATAVPQDLPVADADLVSLLLNILKNALEALQQVEERELFLQFHAENGFFSITCTNTCKVPTEMRNGALSTKPERGHGLGLGLVGDIARKYIGRVETAWGEHSFTIHVFLNLTETEDTNR